MQSKVNIQNKARKHLVENSLTLFYVFKEMHECINTITARTSVHYIQTQRAQPIAHIEATHGGRRTVSAKHLLEGG